MSQDLLNERNKKILQIVVQNYIQTAKPAGSKIICKNYSLKISPATVRNILADLEKEGYLTHPYTSAGRLPTDKGYRFYVDSLNNVECLSAREKIQLCKEYQIYKYELEKMFLQTSRLLSMISHYTGFVLSIQPERNIFKHLKLIRLGNKKILAVFITQSGIVKHRLLQLPLPISAESLKKMCNILNTKMIGYPVIEVKRKIIDKIKEEGIVYEKFLKLAKELNKHIFEVKEEIYLEGISNFFDFANYGRTKGIFKFIKEKKVLSCLLEREFTTEQEENVKVIIGAENYYPEMSDCSVVGSIYRIGNSPVGLLGVIGPKRMEYSRIIPLVDYISRLVNRSLNRLEK